MTAHVVPLARPLASSSRSSLHHSRPLASIRKYWAIAAVSVQSQSAYVGEMLVRTVFLAIVLFIFLQLWTATFETMGRQTIAGFSVPQMLWYLMITESIVLSRPRLTRDVDAEVRAGDVAYQLIRPYDYVWYRLATYAGERVLRLLICGAAGSVLVILYTGDLSLSPTGLVAGLLLFALGLLLDFLGAMAIGLCAFWLEDTQALTLLYDRAIMLLGGMLLPLELLPDPFPSILSALPFQLLVYAPARAAVSGDLSPLMPSLLQLALALLLALLLVRWVFGQALRRLHSNGG